MRNIILFYFILLCQTICNAQIITTYAGNGVVGFSGNGGPATNAKLSSPSSIIFDNNDNLLICQQKLVRKIDALTGIINIIAGDTSTVAIGNGGPATNAYISPGGVCVDASGNLYIGDGVHYEVRKVDISTGIITAYVGTGSGGFSGDNGPATSATLSQGSIGCIDTLRRYLYIIDKFNYRVRRVDMVSNIITTVAGNGLNGYSGDGTLATNAQISRVNEVCIDHSGNFYICDWDNARIRKVDIATGIITTVVGNGTTGYSGDGGPATNAMINTPNGIYFDKCENLYYADGASGGIQRVRKIKATSGIITTIAGNGISGFSGDGGPATNASLNLPLGICFDLSGNLYIADSYNERIRKVTQSLEVDSPNISLSGIISASVGSSVTITATVINAGSSYLIHWLNHGIQFATTTVPSVTYTKPPGIDTITARVVSTASYGCNDSATSVGHTVMVGDAVPFIRHNGELLIYPNPANNIIHVNVVKGQAHYRLLSIIGTLLQEENLKEGSNSIPIQSLPSGLYMVEITNNNGERIVNKIIKQ